MWKAKKHQTLDLLLKSFTKTNPVFRKTRNTFITACLKIVHLQHDGNSDSAGNYTESMNFMETDNLPRKWMQIVILHMNISGIVMLPL